MGLFLSSLTSQHRAVLNDFASLLFTLSVITCLDPTRPGWLRFCERGVCVCEQCSRKMVVLRTLLEGTSWGLVWEHNYFKRLNSKRILLARWRLFLWNLGERYFPGVGRVSADEFMRREIIHKLCLKPMTHSELVKALPLDNELEDEEGVDGIIESVSTFK